MNTEQHLTAWNVVLLYENRTRTDARAVLEVGGQEITGHGEAHHNPYYSDVLRTGDELAAGRALMDLGRELLHVTETDTGMLEGHPVHLKQ